MRNTIRPIAGAAVAVLLVGLLTLGARQIASAQRRDAPDRHAIAIAAAAPAETAQAQPQPPPGRPPMPGGVGGAPPFPGPPPGFGGAFGFGFGGPGFGPPFPLGSPPTAMAVSGNSLYILRGNTVFKLDANTLQVQRQTELPPPSEGPRPPGVPGFGAPRPPGDDR